VSGDEQDAITELEQADDLYTAVPGARSTLL